MGLEVSGEGEASLLAGYKMTPFQVSVNTFRVLSCFDAVGAMEKINVSIGDVLDLYMMSYNAQFKRYFLSAQTGTVDLFTRMPDSERWANYYVEIFDGFSITSHPAMAVPTELGSPSKLAIFLLALISFSYLS